MTNLHTAVAQQLRGAPVASGAGLLVRCRDCGERLREGQPITAIARRFPSGTWSVSEVYCAGADVPVPRGITEWVVLEAELATLSSQPSMSHQLVLDNVDVVSQGIAFAGP